MIDYKNALNTAQYTAVTSDEQAVLVVAGAGSGKTRTIVYRLAWLTEHGVDPSSILLLTFTRKAAKEMISRADLLLDHSLGHIQGGTFHSFAFHTLKIWHPAWLGQKAFTLLDQSDSLNAIKHCQNTLGFKERSFPKTQSIQALISKARNKELPLEEIIRQDSYQLSPLAPSLDKIAREYQKYKREQGLLDYDDLLFELEDLLHCNFHAAASIHQRYQYIMVDEYQDTNLVQARLVQLLSDAQNAASTCRVMAVGDEAQSIYSFRGANVRNILDFPKYFPKARIVRLEENYRSTQPVLDVANTLLHQAKESFDKELYTTKEGGVPVRLIEPKDDAKQAEMVVKRISMLLSDYPPEEIAVLFRSGFHSYLVEAALNREGLPFRKYGGLKYTEAAHIKDCLAFARLIVNPLDFPAFSRIASMHPGIGPKTIDRMFLHIRAGDEAGLNKIIAKYPTFAADIHCIDRLRETERDANQLLSSLVEYYQPRMQTLFPDDWPARQQGLEEVVKMANAYDSLEDFIAEVVLEAQIDPDTDDRGRIILSTIHSAKGLEWDAVLIIDLVEGRFPSKHALSGDDAFEEERRLMYVACTRARKELFLYVPGQLYNRFQHLNETVIPSPFITELRSLSDDSLSQEEKKKKNINFNRSSAKPSVSTPSVKIEHGTPCQHPIFGSGKVLALVDDKTVQVAFHIYGIKTIRKEYLEFGN